MKKDMEKAMDKQGHLFYEREYNDSSWQEVTVPHTFNDVDLFRDRIQDAGSGQKRTVSFYRKWFRVPEGHEGHKVFLAFEGIRQTCYLYVNNNPAG